MNRYTPWLIALAALSLSACAVPAMLAIAAAGADIAVAEKNHTDTYMAQGVWYVCDAMGAERNPKGGC